jgi:gliding motility-associated-like protein
MERGACRKIDTVIVEISNKPTIDRIDSLDIRTREIVVRDGTGIPPYQYRLDHFPFDDDPVKTDLHFGVRTFYIVDDFGCSSDAFAYFMEAPKLFIPPFFSPNGDGNNDTWEIENLKTVYPDAVVTIYDRHGKQLVQYKGSADQGWDGRYLGREMPTTDYWYVIDVNEINKQYVGHFTLLRR